MSQPISQPISQSSPLVIAQITDTHLFADANQTLKECVTAHTLQAVLNQLSQVQPQPNLLLMTGDLSQDETPESYEFLRDRVSPLGIPTYWIPGNHDSSIGMESVLCVEPISTQKCIQAGGWNLILLASAQPNRVEGELSPEALGWLAQQLQHHPEPTLIAIHHPPLPIGVSWMDRIGLQNSQAFLEVIDRHPQVKIVLFGHIHQEFQQQRHGVWYLGTPSTCVQFVPCDKFAIDDRPPGFRLLSLYGDGTHSTQVQRITW